jgi:hypothetical protein
MSHHNEQSKQQNAEQVEDDRNRDGELKDTDLEEVAGGSDSIPGTLGVFGHLDDGGDSS